MAMRDFTGLAQKWSTTTKAIRYATPVNTTTVTKTHPTLPKPKESQIQATILDFLLKSGYRVWRQNTGAAMYEHNGKSRFIRYGYPGISDIIGMTKQGRFLAIEVKQSGKQATALQQQFLNEVTASGGIAFVAHSLEETIEQLTHIT